MKGKLVLALVPLMLCMAMASVHADAEIVWHDVGRDSMSQTIPFEIPFVMKGVSSFSFSNQWVYNIVLDANLNGHVNMKWVNSGNVKNDIWSWNGVEWVYTYAYTQKVRTVSGSNELWISFGEMKTGKQISITHSTEEMTLADPVTGEIVFTYEYAYVEHLILKYLNGQLQFEVYWKIERFG